ncbi:MAG: DUF1801 domain-containing protein [Marinoscillum sp.]
MNEVDQYISNFSPEIREKLEEIRAIIKEEIPEETKEIMNYGIPTFTLNGNLIHFGGFKKHIGFYPTPAAINAFQSELSNYKGAKGSVQFPLDEPLPEELIRKIVKYRVEENLKK